MIKKIENKYYISLFSYKMIILLVLIICLWRGFAVAEYMINNGELLKQGDFDYVMSKRNFSSCMCFEGNKQWTISNGSIYRQYDPFQEALGGSNVQNKEINISSLFG